MELVEGARARHCRTAVDGPTALDTFLPLRWLAGGQLLTVTHPLTEWRGTLDWWVFGDGQLGQASVIINGYPGEAWADVGHPGLDVGEADGARPDRGPSRGPAIVMGPRRAAPFEEAGMSPAVDREGSKWDRAARLLRVATVLHAHPAGISAQAIADQIGVSKRTVYRDLIAMESDAELPIWQDKGKWGLESGVFLPPLALTLPEATTFFLAARVLAKATDEHDSELLSAYVKLADDPAAGAGGAPPRDRRRIRDDAPERAIHTRPAGAHDGAGRSAGWWRSPMDRASTSRTSHRG